MFANIPFEDKDERGKKWVNHKKRKPSFLGVSFSATAYHVYHSNNGKGRETKNLFRLLAFTTTHTHGRILTLTQPFISTYTYMRTAKYTSSHSP